MRTGGIIAIVVGSLGIIVGGFVTIAGSIKGNPEPGIATMVGGGTVLLTGIVLTAVGAHEVSVDGVARGRHPSLAFSPSFTGIKVSF